ncbi:hypothetical protein [Erwinia sp. ErVv1]|uniref:hypothetical protein n=1 Tax=Erwinia sp. ErVv1 TaxID=1603299 RepID=UPI000833CBF7|nr:hypothetical protein [Erwinia sp. ErVv1]
MKYRREDKDGDYTFGKGDNTFLTDSPEAVAQAIKTRLMLWYGQWFLDTTEGTPWMNLLSNRPNDAAVELALRQRILETEGVLEILSFEMSFTATTRRAVVTATVSTRYGTTTVTSEE